MDYLCGWAWIGKPDGSNDPDVVSLQVMVAGSSAFFTMQVLLQAQFLCFCTSLQGWRKRAILVMISITYACWFLFCTTIYGETTAVSRNIHSYASRIAAFLTWVVYSVFFSCNGNRLGKLLSFLAGFLLVVLAVLGDGWVLLAPTVILLALSLPQRSKWFWTLGQGLLFFAASMLLGLAILWPTGCFPKHCEQIHLGGGFLGVQLALLFCMYVLGEIMLETNVNAYEPGAPEVQHSDKYASVVVGDTQTRLLPYTKHVSTTYCRKSFFGVAEIPL